MAAPNHTEALTVCSAQRGLGGSSNYKGDWGLDSNSGAEVISILLILLWKEDSPTVRRSLQLISEKKATDNVFPNPFLKLS